MNLKSFKCKNELIFFLVIISNIIFTKNTIYFKQALINY